MADGVARLNDMNNTDLRKVDNGDGTFSLVLAAPALKAILASAARTASATSAEFTNYHARGLLLLLDVTAVAAPAGQINAIEVQAKIKTNTYRKVAEFTGINLNQAGTRAYLIYPGASDAASYDGKLSTVVPTAFKVVVTHADANSITYSLTGYLLP